ncbi:hypothetical protein AB0P21_09800 [Kribbella sp. NPDC056861]|uniref:hypothetical protein n=1 Tax=Kribbella sp. NPDC056861 TaxID=3154857 RepID=UPI00341611AF
MGVFESNPRTGPDYPAPTAEPTQAGALPDPNQLGEPATAGTEPEAEVTQVIEPEPPVETDTEVGTDEEPDTTPDETDH